VTLAYAALAWAGGSVEPALAQGPDSARSSSLSWVRLPGAEPCPTSTELALSVEAQLGRRVFVPEGDAALVVEGRVERLDAGWRAVIVVSDRRGEVLGERALESDAEECTPLGEMASTAIALMIDPWTAPPPSAPMEAASAPPAAFPSDDDAGLPPELRERPMELPTAPAPAPGWRVELDVGLVGSVGLSPHPNLGGFAGVVLEPPGFVPVALHGALFPYARAESSAGSADLLHVQIGAQLCPLWTRERRFALHLCLGLDAGAVAVLGGTADLDERERVIGQAHAEARVHWDLSGLVTVRASAHFVVPFRQGEPFTVAGAAFYTPEPVAGLLDLGVGVHFE
jgi:hypothetical protein